MDCPMCESSEVQEKKAFFDPCGGAGDSLFECTQCGAEWFAPKQEENGNG